MAGPYRQILVAFELEEASDQALIDKALQWAHGDQVAFSIVHSIEHMASFGSAYGVTAGIDVDAQPSVVTGGVVQPMRLPPAS